MNDPAVEKKFRRFLYICSLKSPKYLAKNWNKTEKEERTIFSQIVETLESANAAIDIIKTAKENSTFPSQAIYSLAFIITLVSKDSSFYPIRDKIYKIIPEILETPEELFLFNKYTTELELKKGTRWQNCINAWYLGRSSDALVEDMLTVKSRFGWTHKDLRNLLHSPAQNNDKIFLKYIYGGSDAVLSIPNVSEDIKTRVKIITQFKSKKDFNEIAETIRVNKFIKFQHVPLNFLYNKHDTSKVWKAIINRMDVSQILQNIMKLQDSGLLHDRTGTTKKGKDMSQMQITNEIVTALSKATTCPFAAYIVYCNYKNYCGHPKERKHWSKKDVHNTTKEGEEEQGNSQVKAQPKQKHRKMPPSPSLIEALKLLTERSLQATEKVIDANCMITLDMKEYMFKSLKTKKNYQSKSDAEEKKDTDETVQEKKETSETTAADKTKQAEAQKAAKCFYNKNVIPGHAGILLALYFSKYIKNTTVAVYTHNGITPVELYDNVDGVKKLNTMEEAEKKLKAIAPANISLDMPFEQALATKKDYDVFINIVDTPSRARKKRNAKNKEKPTSIKDALFNYREMMNIPLARTVTLALSTQRAMTTDGSTEGILDISGFDEHVPRVIENFINKRFY